MKHAAVSILLVVLLALGAACGKSEDRTEDAIKAAQKIINTTITNLDAVTAKVKDVKTGKEAADIVGEFITTALSVKSEVGSLEKQFPAKSIDKKKVEEALKTIMNETKAAGKRFGAALMGLSKDILQSKEFVEAVKKLQKVK